MVATGLPLSASVLTEVIDLADESTTCEALPEYPIHEYGASGGLVNDSLPLICGGNAHPNYVGNCYIPGYGSKDSLVTLLTPRAGSAAITMESHMWITGGWDGSNVLMSTEIVDVVSSPAFVVQGPELPMAMSGHCIVKVNGTTVLFVYKRKTFFFDYATQAWANGPDTNHERLSSGCGIMENVVVVAGGHFSETTTEFLTLDDPNGLKWSAGTNRSHILTMIFSHNYFITIGPDLPKPLFGLSAVEFDGTVIIIGGYSASYPQNCLYKLVCSNDTNCEWSEMSQKLKVGRSGFVAMLIPDELADCH